MILKGMVAMADMMVGDYLFSFPVFVLAGPQNQLAGIDPDTLGVFTDEDWAKEAAIKLSPPARLVS
jgi:hypothetical protein